MYLVDTNVWLELLLEQKKAEEVHQFLESVDAYQYAAAKRDGLILVSFDSDFDKTDIGRKTSADLLSAIET